MIRVEDRNPLHAHAVGVALGFFPPFVLWEDGVTQHDLGDEISRMLAGENDADAEFPTHVVEEIAKKVDPAFSLSSQASEQIAMSLRGRVPGPPPRHR